MMGNFSRNTLCCLIGLGFIASACGGGDDDLPPPADVRGPEGAGNTTGAGTGGTALIPDTDNCNGEGAPVVELTIDEGLGEGIYTESITARCAVAQSEDEGSLPYDPETVTFVIEDADGETPIVATEFGSRTDNADEYEATIAIASLESKSYSLRCTASDTNATEPTCGSSEEDVSVDAGPNIEIRQPGEEQSLSAGDGVVQNFEYRIEAADLTGDDGDELAGDLVVTIHGQPFPLVPKEGTDDIYWIDGGVELSDESAFPEELPDGETQITVTASNGRGVERSLTYSVLVDGNGPTVEFLSPSDLQTVGKEVVLRMRVTDDYSDVDWSSLVVSSSGEEKKFDAAVGEWSRAGDEVALTFFVDEFITFKTLTLNVVVEDSSENTSRSEITFRLDEWGPIVSLQPPNFRLVNGDLECSHAFNPVGDDAVVHGQSISSTGIFRAVIWDRTTTAGDDGRAYFSGVNNGTTRLWFADAAVPLVEDSDGDGFCDRLNDAADPQLVDLDPATPRGGPYFGTGTMDPVEADSTDPDLGACHRATAGNTPDRLCGSQLRTAIHRTNADNNDTPALYGVNVTDTDCVGDAYSPVSSVVVNGWVCVAATAEDNVGNIGVSEPIAICLHSTGDQPSCWNDPPEAAPTCRSECSSVTFTTQEPSADGQSDVDDFRADGVIYRQN